MSTEQVTGEILIERPVDEVFDFVADERNEPRYNPRMTTAQKITAGPVSTGTRYRAEVKTVGQTSQMTIEITGYDRPRRLETATQLARMDIRGTLAFEPVSTGTRLRWSWQLTPHGLLRLAKPLIIRQGRRQERANWASLKRHLEAPRTAQ